MAWILSSGESLKGFKQSHDVLTDHSSVRKIEQCELKKESKAIADNPPRRAVQIVDAGDKGVNWIDLSVCQSKR